MWVHSKLAHFIHENSIDFNIAHTIHVFTVHVCIQNWLNIELVELVELVAIKLTFNNKGDVQKILKRSLRLLNTFQHDEKRTKSTIFKENVD